MPLETSHGAWKKKPHSKSLICLIISIWILLDVTSLKIVLVTQLTCCTTQFKPAPNLHLGVHIFLNTSLVSNILWTWTFPCTWDGTWHPAAHPARARASQGKTWGLGCSLTVHNLAHNFVTEQIKAWRWPVHSCVMVWQYKAQNSLFCELSPSPTLPQPWPAKAELPSASTQTTMAVIIHHS